jgi:Polysaccharide pyruvyl transferase
MLLLGDTRSVGHHGSSSVVKVIMEQLGHRGVDVSSSISHLRALSDPSTLRRGCIQGIVINAEGALHGRSKHAMQFSKVAASAIRAGVPCFIINAVLDGCDREVIANLRRVTKLYCRESRSKIQADLLEIPAELCPDLTFALKLPNDLHWTPGPRIIVTDSTVSDTNQLLHAFAVRNAYSFLPLRGAPQITSFADMRSISRAIKFTIRSRGGRLFKGNFHADRYGCAVSTPEHFLNEIARGTRLIVSGRFHGICLCLKVGVPFLAVCSNTHKVEGLLEDAGIDGRLIDIRSLSKNGTSIAELDTAGAWSAADEDARRRYVDFAQDAIKTCFDTIASAVKNVSP